MMLTDGNTVPQSFDQALQMVRASDDSQGFALLGERNLKRPETRLDIVITGDATDIRYQELVTCDLQMVGEEFSRKPYAIALQQGSPLKDQLNDA